MNGDDALCLPIFTAIKIMPTVGKRTKMPPTSTDHISMQVWKAIAEQQGVYRFFCCCCARLLLPFGNHFLHLSSFVSKFCLFQADNDFFFFFLSVRCLLSKFAGQ